MTDASSTVQITDMAISPLQIEKNCKILLIVEMYNLGGKIL
jgi:hypothetical protein